MLIGFHFIYLFKKKMLSFMASYLIFKKKNLEGKRCDPWKNSKKQKNGQKTLLSSAATWILVLAWKTLKFGFLYFRKSCRELNFLSVNTNPESIGILNRKLEPKYEIGAKDNTNSTSFSTFFQNFKWGTTPNLIKLI